MTNAVQNFQIPVVDFDRALKFYNRVMGYDLKIMEFQGTKWVFSTLTRKMG